MLALAKIKVKSSKFAKTATKEGGDCMCRQRRQRRNFALLFHKVPKQCSHTFFAVMLHFSWARSKHFRPKNFPHQVSCHQNLWWNVEDILLPWNILINTCTYQKLNFENKTLESLYHSEEGVKKRGGIQKYAIVKDWPFFQRMEEQKMLCFVFIPREKNRVHCWGHPTTKS